MTHAGTAGAKAGFTLIEVMVAVVILAIGLTSLFTSEAGAVRIAQRARTTTIATMLARCKMGEVEERVSKGGFPAEIIDGRDECCTGGEHDGFSCSWKVERIVLPEMGGEEGDTGGTGGGGKLAGGFTGGRDEKGAGLGLAPGAAPGSSSRALPSAFAGIGDAGAGGDGGILGSMVTSLGESSGGGDPLTAMVMELTFPVMKPVIEEGVRRASVTVSWKEGDSEQTFDVVQYLVNEAPMLPSESMVEAAQTGGTTAGGAAGGGAAGGSSTTNTRSTTSTTSTSSGSASGATR
jgi:general secretion pathway protein I